MIISVFVYQGLYTVDVKLFQVPDSDFILVIATLEDFQISRLSVDGLGGSEQYHRLDLWNDSTLYKNHLCASTETVVSVKGMVTK